MRTVLGSMISRLRRPMVCLEKKGGRWYNWTLGACMSHCQVGSGSHDPDATASTKLTVKSPTPSLPASSSMSNYGSLSLSQTKSSWPLCLCVINFMWFQAELSSVR